MADGSHEGGLSVREQIERYRTAFIAVVAMVAIAAVTGGYILAHQNLKLPGWVPLIGRNFYTLKAEFQTAQAVTPGQGQAVTIAGAKGERTSPVEKLCTDYLETTIAAGEIITSISVPAMGSRRAAYLKCTTRSADDWPALGVAVVLDGEKTDIVVSAATDRPTRLASVESAEGLKIESDLHGSAAYKKQLLRVYLKRAIDEARNARH